MDTNTRCVQSAVWPRLPLSKNHLTGHSLWKTPRLLMKTRADTLRVIGRHVLPLLVVPQPHDPNEPRQETCHRRSLRAGPSSSSGSSGVASPDLYEPCHQGQQVRRQRFACRACCCPTSYRTSRQRSVSGCLKKCPGSTHCRSGSSEHRVARRPMWRSNHRRCLYVVSMAFMRQSVHSNIPNITFVPMAEARAVSVRTLADT